MIDPVSATSSSRKAAYAFFAVLLLCLAIISAVAVAQPFGTSSASSSSAASSSTQAPSNEVDDPLLDIPSSPALYHETCVTPDYPNGNSTDCTSTTSTLGVSENITMGGDFVSYAGGYTETVYEHFFAFVLSANDTIQFTYRGVPYGSEAASVTVYFDGNTAINFTDLRGLVDSGSLKMLTSSPGAYEAPTDRFSGQLAGRPGVYVFDLYGGNGGGGMAYFLVRDESALQQGIKVSIGSPEVVPVAFSGDSCGGGPDEGGVGEEEFPVTVTSNSTTNVNLVSPDVPSGVWVKFTPSVLQGVGPQGARSTLLLAGDVDPFSPNVYNVSLFIDAFSPSGGLTGESFLPLDAAYGYMDILHSPGPVGGSAAPNQGIIFDTNGSPNGTTYTPVSEGNQTNYAGIATVYDPPSNVGNASSLLVKITGVGLMQNGSETTLPPWIAARPVNSSFDLAADKPYDLQVCVSISNSPPLGDFTLVLNETVNGQGFSCEIALQIGAVTYD